MLVSDGGHRDNSSDADIESLYKALRRIRRVEERVAEIYPSDKIKSPIHLAIGQEFISVGVCDSLRPGDVVSGTYRGHALYLARGGDLAAMMAEMYGKSTGCAGGKGGSMHLIGIDDGILGTSAVVGTHIPIATGYAMALKRKRKDQVVACFFGDGATEEGVFYESINFASLHTLPILFICENNFFAIHTPLNKRWATESLCERVAAFGMPAHRITDGDVFAIRTTASTAIERIRDGSGPEFMECHAYRWLEHVGPDEDYDAGYRTPEEAEPWMENDQVARLARMLEPDVEQRINSEVEVEIDGAVEFAENSPVPDIEDLTRHVFSD